MGATKEYQYDDYGYLVTKPRKQGCRCTNPCQKSFKCTSEAHRGQRSTPYCLGAADRWPGFCDTCAMRALKVEEES